MAPDEQQRADALDRLWDSPPGGRPDAAVDERVAELAGLIERLRSASAIPDLFPDPWQGWQDLRQPSRLGAPRTSSEAFIPPRSFSPNGGAGREDVRRAGSRGPRLSGSWLVNQLATAAILLLALAVGFVALLNGVRGPEIDAVPAPAFVRALNSVSGNVVDVPLVQARFVPGELPPESPVAIFYQLTIAPGATLPNLSGPSSRDPATTKAPSVGAEAVQSGVYALRLDAPFRIQRRGAIGDSDVIPARTEVTLGPGDAAIYPNYAAPGEIRNAATEPVVIVGVALVSGDCLCDSSSPGLPEGVTGEQLALSLPSDWSKIPAGPVALTLWRVALPAGASVGPYEPIGLESVWVEAGTVRRSIFREGMTEPGGPALVLLEEKSMPFTGTPPGIRQTLATGEETPAEFFVVTIEPAGFWPAPPRP